MKSISGILLLLVVSLLHLSVFAEELKAPTQAEIASQTVVDDSAKAVVKSLLTGVLTGDTVPEGLGKEVRDALSYWKGNAEGLKQFAGRLEKMAADNSQDFLKLVRSGRLREFAVAALDESSGSAFRNVNADRLKALVAYGSDGLDDAGTKALEVLNRVENAITRTGQVPADLAGELQSAMRQLTPEQARAARQLLAEKGTRGVVRDYLKNNPTVIGTFVDGVFVLAFDVPALTCLSDAEEALAGATGTGFGFVFQAAGNAATAAVGGGFLPGLVVSWSSAQVKELVTEMIMLQYDRGNAAMKEQWAGMELRMNAIRGMLKVDEQLKAGKTQAAGDYLAKVERYAVEHSFPNEGIFEKIKDLKGVVAKAEERRDANQIIARARIPYMAGYRLASQGRNLNQARADVQEALAVLQEGQAAFPELADRVAQVQALLENIDRMIALALPLGQPTVAGPDSVAPGEIAHFEVSLTGGIPDYRPVDMNGLGLSSGAVFYWEAPSEPGVKTVTFRIRDDAGKTAEVVKEVEVTGEVAASGQSGEMTGEVWEVMKDTPMLSITFESSASSYGTTRKTIQAEVVPGTDMSFPVSYNYSSSKVEGTGRLQFSSDGQTIIQLSLDLDDVSPDYGLMAKEEIRLGPFREVSLDPKYNLVSKTARSAKDGLRYVYAVGDREPRGTYRYGEHSFSDTGQGLQKAPLKWNEVERVEFDQSSNAWHTFEKVQIRFQMK